MRRFSLCTVLVAVLFVAGCGGGGGGGTSSGQASGLAAKPANEVVADAANAAQAASSFHMSGQIHGSAGQFDTSGKPVGIDLSIVRGKGATGSLTVGGAEVDLIVVGNNGYLRASSAFWRKYAKQAGALAAQLFADKWLKFPANSKQFGPLTDPTNANSLFKSLTTAHGKLENKGETTFKGQSVVAIFDTTKNGTLYVAASGTPYPVGLIKTTGSNGGTVSFDRWNEPVTLTAPKGALDLSQFGSG